MCLKNPALTFHRYHRCPTPTYGLLISRPKAQIYTPPPRSKYTPSPQTRNSHPPSNFMENPGNKFSVLNIKNEQYLFHENLKADFREISPAAGISIALLLLFIHLIRIMYWNLEICNPDSRYLNSHLSNLLSFFII